MNNLTFLRADKNDIQQLKALWLECFDEKQTAADLFFDIMFDSVCAYCVKYKQHIASALYLIPCTLKNQKSHYLCGAATKPEYRCHGIMGRLIQFALEKSVESKDIFSILFPAQTELYDFYCRYGYEKKCSAAIVKKTRKQLESEHNNLHLCSSSKNALESSVVFKKNFVDFAVQYYGAYGVKSICKNNMFALFEENNNTANVFYFSCYDEHELVNALLHNTKAENFTFTKSFNINENTDKIEYGMIKSLNKNIKIPNDVFIGITLD